MKSPFIRNKIVFILLAQWRAVIISLLFIILASSTIAQPYKDPLLPIDVRVKDLVERMTTEEKFWQMFMLAGGLSDGAEKYKDGAFGFQLGTSGDSIGSAVYVNSIQRHFIENTRLGIPVIFFEEALHGLVQKNATSFPQAIGLAATFDTSLMHQVAGAIAIQCRSRGIRQVLSPVVNIASDVRWGRTEETYGEDPFLASAMGVAFVSEFEKRGVITTPKHLVANVGAGGRDSYPIDISERLLREIFLPPFEACIREGSSRSIMTSYNSLDGTPCSANNWLNVDWLKNEVGFKGFIISDAGGVGGANVLHFTAKDYTEATELAIKGGLDVIFQTSFEHYKLFIRPFEEGRISAAAIDSAVTRVLRPKFELGLFEHPYVGVSDSLNVPDNEEYRQLARKAAQESIVLLKNDCRTLPLSKNIKSIAVIGADAVEARLGGYSGHGNNLVNILDGIETKLGESTKVVYAEGCPRTSIDYATVPSEYLTYQIASSIGNGLIGEYFDNINLDGQPAFTRFDPQVQFQWTLFSPDQSKLAYDWYSVRWTGKLRSPRTGTYKIGIDGNDGYRVYLGDSLIIDNWRKVSRQTVMVDWNFEINKLYDLRIEYFEPSGNAWFRLVWNVELSDNSDSAITAAEKLAGACDAAIIVAGIEEGEFRDRVSLNLPGRQEELINRIAATGKPTIVVLVGGSAITMNRWINNIAAVLDIWYPGEAGGYAVADVLFGDYNPAGRLPITFPVAEGQLPLVYNHKPTGRGDDYIDLTGQPLFPFGYGLSYTKFEYSDLKFDQTQITAGDSTLVHCTIKNIGAMAGDEVVQLYIHDEIASVAQPVIQLKGFKRIYLEPGQSQEVSFMVDSNILSLLDKNLKWIVEPGEFRIMIGASCKDIRLRGILNVTAN